MNGCDINQLCSSSPTSLGPSLEEKLFSSCDLMAEKKAQVSFKSQRTLAPNRATVSAQFHSSTKARNWAEAPGDLSSAFTIETPQPEAPARGPTAPSPQADTPPPQTSSDGGEKINHFLTVSLSAFDHCRINTQSARSMGPVFF